MRTIAPRTALAIVATVALVMNYGCILSPDEGGGGGDNNTVQFKPLTDKENVIYNLVLCYKAADFNHYNELLHPDFTFHNQKDPLNPGLDEQWNKAQDIQITTNMFNSTRGQNPDPNWNLNKLELTITTASWAPVDSIGGAPCDDCWQTTREYYITAVTDGGDTYIGNDLSLFIVVPVTEGSTKLYKLWRQDDLPK